MAKNTKKTKAKLFLKKFLTYEDVYEAIEYRDEPTDSMEYDLDMLANRQPFYIERISKTQRKPKKIYVEDHPVSQGLLDQGCEEFYKFLIEQGAELYFAVRRENDVKIFQAASYDDIVLITKKYPILSLSRENISEKVDILDYDARLKVSKKILPLLPSIKPYYKNFHKLPVDVNPNNHMIKNIFQARRVSYLKVPSHNLLFCIENAISLDKKLEELDFDYLAFKQMYLNEEIRNRIIDFLATAKYKRIVFHNLIDDELSGNIFKAICQNSDISSIKILTSPSFLYSNFSSPLTDSQKSLRSITCSSASSTKDFSKLLNEFPNITKISIANIQDVESFYQENESKFYAPNLLNFSITEPCDWNSFKIVLQLLAKNTQIEKLQLELSDLNSIPENELHHILAKMPTLSLESLKIVVKQGENFDQLVRIIRCCPNLKKLELCGPGKIDLSLIAQCQCPLSTLKIECDSVSTDGLFDCFEKFSGLTNLSINAKIEETDNIRACPEKLILKKLVIHPDNGSKSFKTSLLKSILKASQASLKHIDISTEAFIPDKNLSDFSLPKLKSISFNVKTDYNFDNPDERIEYLSAKQMLADLLKSTQNLKNLNIQSITEPTLPAKDHFLGFSFLEHTKQAFSSLKSLTISNLVLPVKFLHTLPDHAKNLEDLEINCLVDDAVFLKQVASTNQSIYDLRLNSEKMLNNLKIKSNSLPFLLSTFWRSRNLTIESKDPQLVSLKMQSLALETFTGTNVYFSEADLDEIPPKHPKLLSFRIRDYADHFTQESVDKMRMSASQANTRFIFENKQTERNRLVKHFPSLLNRLPVKLHKDTSLSNSPLDAKYYFENIHPSIYRLDINNGYKIQNGSLIEIPYKFDPAKLLPIRVEQLNNSDLITKFVELKALNPQFELGRDVYTLKPGEWQPLPSMARRETLKYINHNVDIGYDPEIARYYIKLKDEVKTPQKLDIRFIEEAFSPSYQEMLPAYLTAYLTPISQLRFGPNGLIHDDNYSILAKLPLNALCKLFYHYIYNFSREGKPLVGELSTDVDVLNALLTQQTGACLHRALLFSALASEFGIRHQQISNDTHSYIEASWQENDQWIEPLKLDLGGYPATLNTLNKNEDFRSEDQSHTEYQKKEEELILPPGLFNDLEENSDSIFDKTHLNSNLTPPADFDAFLMRELEKTSHLNDNKRNILIAIEDDQVAAFHAALLRYYKTHDQEMFYVPNLDSIFDQAGVIENGKIIHTPSALANFVKNAKPMDSLIVNWSNYNNLHLGHNSIMDDVRRIGSSDIPNGVVNIGFITRSEVDRLGEDLTSRFKVFAQCPKNLLQDITCPKISSLDEIGNETNIPFYTSNWRSKLIGKMAFDESNASYLHGALIDALNNKSGGIVLQNAPWHLEDFQIFYNDLVINRKFSANGMSYELPESFTIKRCDEPFKLSLNRTTVDSNPPPETSYILNKETLTSFIQGLKARDKKIISFDGILSENPELDIYVTDSDITFNQWAWFLSEANKQQCQLRLHVAPGIQIPDELSQLRDQSTSMEVDYDKTNTRNRVIETKDLEAAEFYINDNFPDSNVISVSKETTLTELIGRLEKNPEGGEFSFEFIYSKVYRLLADGNNTVVLKGDLSAKLRQQLESLFVKDPYLYLNGKKHNLPGRLVLLTTQPNAIPIIESTKVTITPENQWAQLSSYVSNQELVNALHAAVSKFESLSNYKFSYAQLKVMFQKIEKGNYSNPFAPFFRLLPNHNLQYAKQIWRELVGVKPKKIIETSDEFHDKRKEKFRKQINSSPYTFMVGSSGSGKSTFFLETISDDPSLKVHVGANNILEWANTHNDKLQILFLDEANLELPGVWENLAGIFDKPPGVFIKNNYYPLSPNHKIVFAGNYSTFEGRYQHNIFEKYGNIITFKDMPDVVIRDSIILPALNKLFPKQPFDMVELANIFLSFYNKVNTELSKDKPLTPRNIKTMCLRLKLYVDKHNKYFSGEDSLQKMACMAAYDEVVTSLNQTERVNLKNGLDNHSKLSNAERKTIKNLIKAESKSLDKMVITKSRKNPLRMLRDGLGLREIKLNNPELHDLYVPGLLYEGGSGIGKSTMITAQLRELNYVPATEDNIDMPNRFYVLTPGKREAMKKMLFKAFHEGAIIVIDEFNSLFLEKELNAYLSGADLFGKPPNKSGFYVIASQNPATMSKRSKLSEALLKRLQKMDLKDYTPEELIEVVTKLSNDNKYARTAARDYLRLRAKEDRENLVFKSTPRTLFDIVNQKPNPNKRALKHKKVEKTPTLSKRPKTTG